MASLKTSKRGMGGVYQRKGSRFWWIRYWVHGRPRWESSKSEDRNVAIQLLATRVARRDRLAGIRPTSLVEALDDYIRDARGRGVRAIPLLEQKARRLVAELGDAPISRITTPAIRDLQEKLAARGLAGGTINGDVSVLRASLKFAAENGYLDRVPIFPRGRKTSAPRAGFLEREDYEAIRRELPAWAADVFDFAYVTGWRRNEVLYLTWNEVDGSVLRLGPGRSKNGEGRVRPITAELEPVLQRRKAARVVGLPFVFHRGGKRISLSFWTSTWRKATTAAGRPKVILHDCRRTAVRNLLRAGVPERVAMELTGHRTRTVFDRYNIVSESDLRTAGEKLGVYLGK